MSIKEIAKKTGVSPATVSRVLNNPEYHCSDPEKRDKIWKAAMELNYVPNEAARNLKRGTSSNPEKVLYIQVLMTHTEKNQSDPFFSELLRIVESEIHRNSCILSQVWYMSIFSSDKQCRLNNMERVISDLYDETEGKTNGVIVIGRCNKDALRLLKKRFKNVVSINRNPTNREVDEVTCDGKKIARTAIEYLLELGHTDIGYVGECHNESRYKGYLEALAHHDIEPTSSYIKEIKQTEAAGYEIMKEIMEEEDTPSAIYCANDITAIGMLKALAKSKNRYFQISIISSDNIEQAQFTTPMLTTVALPKEEMARFAVNLLISRMRGHHSSVVTMELEGNLLKRESCISYSDSSWNYYI